MLKLMPILEHMGAWAEMKSWAKEKNFATFDEMWAACPKLMWADLVVTKLWPSSRPLWVTHDHGAYKAAVRDVECWLVEYAHRHGCAVEVTQ